MLRWLFLLLLLGNAIVLLWAALMQREEVPAATASPATQGVTLRLLSEVDPAELQPVASGAGRSEPQSFCVAYGELEDRAAADQVAALMRQYRLSPQVQSRRVALPSGYALVLQAPEASAARIALIERIEAQGVVPESRPGDSTLVLARFDTEAAARQAASRYRAAGLTPEVRTEDRTENRFSVVIPVVSDRNLFNKINRVLENSYPGIKIEKKPCEGVASPEVDQ